MKEYYPWNEEGVDPECGSSIIWRWMRNPITHRLGLLSTSEPPVVITKSPLNIQQIEELEDLSIPIHTLRTIVKEKDTYYISVSGLYRGLHNMLKRLFEDKEEMQRAS